MFSARTQESKKSLEMCPDCGAEIPIFDEYKWCDKCDWNLVSMRPDDGSSYRRLYRYLGKKAGQALFDELVEGRTPAPRQTPSKILAYAIASLVHLSTLVLVALAVAVFFLMHAIAAGLLAIFLLVVAWVLRPRRFRSPERSLSRQAYPKLYEIVNRTTDGLKADRFHSIAISSEFNAFYGEHGLGPFKKRVLILGLPLLELLEPEEFVALIAHEASHGINGDVVRGTFIGSALLSLNAWYLMLCPASEYEGQIYEARFSGWMANVLGALLATIPSAVYYVLAHLLLRQNQECEYLADRLASEVAGTKPFILLLEKLRLGGIVGKYVEKAAAAKANVFDLLKNGSHVLSAREIERQRRLEEWTGLSLDATHPPLEYRIRYLTSFPERLRQVEVTSAEMAMVHAELLADKRKVSSELIDDYMDMIT